MGRKIDVLEKEVADIVFFRYCPEVKMTLEMDLKEKTGEGCTNRW